ncbi:MAG: MIP family channel protein [Anaerostipes sp.]|nr:MIP family channel protein [Anaerostipes sp.]
MNNTKKYVAEFIGTAVLTLFGCGSAVAINTILAEEAEVPLGFSTLLIAFAFGLALMAMAYSIGSISGCHVNPAVSIGFLISKRMEVKDCICYIIAQILGGIFGATLLTLILRSNGSLGTNGFGKYSALNIDMSQALLVEAILTFVFVFVILAVTSKAEFGSIAGLIIGLTLVIIHIFGIPFTGTSVNPARSLGPAIMAGGDALSQVWVFIVAPIVGGILAGLLYLFFFTGNEEA